MIIINLVFFLVSFVALWYGAGLIVKSTDKFSKQLKIPSFLLSFFVLGNLTSLPEITISLNAVLKKDPQIFVGDLIGGVFVIFLFIVPVLAIIGNGLKISDKLSKRKLFLSLVVSAMPAFFITDGHISPHEGLFLILIYLALFFLVERKQGVTTNVEKRLIQSKDHHWREILRIAAGIIIVFLSSRVMINETVFFSNILRISSFFISLIILSIGTNIPELSVGIRSVFLGKKDIAMGDYVGSTTANTWIFGLATFLYGKNILISSHFLKKFIVMVIGLSLLYFFSTNKNKIPRANGIILLFVYIIFLLIEVGIH